MKKVFICFSVLLLVVILVSCGSKTYVDYMSKYKGFTPTYGSSTNNETIDLMASIYNDESVKNINVLPVSLKDETIIGVDMSSIIEVEQKGGKFFNDEGKEQDVFEILSDKGVNYVRIRLWNEPYTVNNISYGGGSNDIKTDLLIAKRAARVGMKILLNFHYSDFWADPKKQSIPRMWQNLDILALEDAVYKYTYDVIKQFEKEGVRPHMVQIGNEINNGFMFPQAPTSLGFRRISDLLKKGLKAVKDVSSDIKTVIHLAEGASESSLIYYFDKLIENEVDFDIIGLSYYSYWHGTMETFNKTLKALDKKYKQDIVVMEYSYGFTTKEHENANHIFNSELAVIGGYNNTFQGQASYIRDIYEAINSIEKGIGAFYWEPSWLPIKNAGWASEGARTYLESQGDDTSSLGNVSWANQALFTYSGKASPVLNVFKEMKTSTYSNEYIISYEKNMTGVLNIRSNDTLPKYINAYTNLDRLAQLEVTWNKSDVEKITETGTYIINGLVKSGNEEKEVILTLEAFENFMENPSFEQGGKVTSDVTDFNLVPYWQVTQSQIRTVKLESKNPRKVDNDGANNINIYSTQNYTFSLLQEVNLRPGTYELSVWSRSEAASGILMPNVNLVFKNNQTILQSSKIIYGNGWSQWQQTKVVIVIENEMILQIGLEGQGGASSWAHFDDFQLQRK